MHLKRFLLAETDVKQKKTKKEKIVDGKKKIDRMGYLERQKKGKLEGKGM